METSGKGAFSAPGPENLLDLGPAQSRFLSGSALIDELAERLFLDEPGLALQAKNAATHHLRLLFAREKINAHAPVSSETMAIVFSRLGSGIEFIIKSTQGIENAKEGHYRLLQEISAIKVKRLLAVPGTQTGDETVQEINSAIEVHLEYLRLLLGKRFGEFERELEKIEKSVV